MADLSHLLLDYTNNYGIRPFAPFHPRWYSWDIVFIFEPVMFLLLLGGLLIPALLGLVDREISSEGTYFVDAAGRLPHWLAWPRSTRCAARNMRARCTSCSRHPSTSLSLRVAAEPYPINPFRWQGIVETDNAYHFADVGPAATAWISMKLPARSTSRP